MPKDIFTVVIDGQEYDLEGDHEPTEAEARAALGAMPAVSHNQERTWTDTAVDALPTVGGAIGGLAGGGRGPVAAVTAGAGGLIGERARQYANAIRGEAPLPPQMDAVKSMLKEGATQGAAEAGGRTVGAGLRLIGRGFYRAAALPIQQAYSKYGDLIATGLKNRVPVGKSGLEKSGRLMTSRMNDKATALAAADAKASVRTAGVLDDAAREMRPHAEAQRAAGYPDPTEAFTERASRITDANGPGMTPSKLESVKSTIDDQLGPAYKKVRMREALSPQEKIDLELSQAMGRSQENVVPGYRGMNKEIMDAAGLKRMIARRVIGTGSNQGLENAATMAVGPAAIPARVLMLPPVSSRVGIAANEAGQHPAVFSNAVRAALLAMMSQPHQQPEPDESQR